MIIYFWRFISQAYKDLSNIDLGSRDSTIRGRSKERDQNRLLDYAPRYIRLSPCTLTANQRDILLDPLKNSSLLQKSSIWDPFLFNCCSSQEAIRSESIITGDPY